MGNDSAGMSYLADILAVQDLLLYSLGSGFLIGFFYMIFLRLCGGPIIYITIVLTIVASGFGSFMLYQTSQEMCGLKGDFKQFEQCKDKDEQQPFYLIGSYVLLGVMAIFLICAIFNQKNIRIGVAIMKCTAAFIGGTPQVFLIPPISLIFILSWLVVYVIIALHIGSVGQIKPRDDLPFLTTVEYTDETKYVGMYSLFGYLWLNAFLIGVA